MQASRILSVSPSSPSFNTYSSGRLADIAARVVDEFRRESGNSLDYDYDDDIYEAGWPHHQHQEAIIEEEEEEEEDDGGGGDGDGDDFEFPFVCQEPDASPITTADEIFYNGQIRPTYPLFNTDLLLDDGDAKPAVVYKPRRLPLGKLMSEDRDSSTASCSSSEADELDGLTPGSYCVWKPKLGSTAAAAEEESPGRCKKSNSTGSSKRWKLRDLLYRSHSDGHGHGNGKDSTTINVFLAPPKTSKADHHHGHVHHHGHDHDHHHHHHHHHQHQQHCGSKGEKRRSYLPYRPDLVGFFSNNVNGLSRNLHPF